VRKIKTEPVMTPMTPNTIFAITKFCELLLFEVALRLFAGLWRV
jgi:hypothetical protein